MDPKKKEEILAKARNETKEFDEREAIEFLDVSRISLVFSAFLSAIVLFAKYVVTGVFSAECVVIFFGTISFSEILLYIKLKKKKDLAAGIITLLLLCMSIFIFIYQLYTGV